MQLFVKLFTLVVVVKRGFTFLTIELPNFLLKYEFQVLLYVSTRTGEVGTYVLLQNVFLSYERGSKK